MKQILTFLFLILSVCGKAQDEQYKEGIYHFTKLQYEKAYSCFDTAQALYHTQGQLDKEWLSLYQMGDCLYSQGKLDECIRDYMRALQVASSSKDLSAEYKTLTVLKKVYSEKNDMQNAMIISSKIDSMLNNSESSTLTLPLLSAQAKEAMADNNMEMAEHFYLKKETILDSFEPSEERNQKLLNVYHDIWVFYINTDQYEKALQYSNKLINLGKEIVSSSMVSNYYAERAYNYGLLKQKDMMDNDLNIAKNGLKIDENPYFILNYFYHFYAASAYMNFKEWGKSSSEIRKAIIVLERNDVKNDMLYDLKVQLGVSLYRESKYDEARGYFEDNLLFRKKENGELSLQYANALKYLARIEYFCNDFESAKKHFLECRSVLKNLVNTQLRFVSLQERNTFWGKIEPTLRSMTIYPLNMGSVQDEFTQNCYDALLFSKALLLETDKTMAEAINTECTPEEKQVYYEWQALRQKLKSLGSDAENNEEQIATLQQKTTELDNRLTTITSRLGYTNFLVKEYKDVKASLKSDELLLDFTDYFIDEKNVTQHMAYVIDNKQEYPLLLQYVTTEDVMALLDGLPMDRIHDASLKGKVQEMFWMPFTPYASGKKTIYYVPSGILHQVALESLPMEDGTLLGEHYKFVRLTSAREIERYKNDIDISGKSEALLYGGLKYSLDDATMQAAAAQYDTPPLFAWRGAMRGDSIFHDLPYSLEEVNSTKKILDKRGVKTKVLSGAEGTEESFIALDGKAPQILHLSTHGFYYTPEQASEVEYLKGYQDAMALSGLILSGANAAWLGKELPKGVMGGVLTASTITRLNLKGVDLLFLGACQSGNGKATPEGVYGLQRAFKKAGVKTIVMNLWDVDDKVAKEFAVSFYQELARNKGDKRTAFEKAKRHIREMEDYDKPFYWAGFVMLD